MYNRPFTMEVTGTSPYAYKIDDEPIVGITITGKVETAEVDFLDDLVINIEKKRTISILLSGRLPIDKEVSLAFNQRKDLRLKFPGCKTLSCELAEVDVLPMLVNNILNCSLKIKVTSLPKEEAGEIVKHLKQHVVIELVLAQEDMFDQAPSTAVVLGSRRSARHNSMDESLEVKAEPNRKRLQITSGKKKNRRRPKK